MARARFAEILRLLAVAEVEFVVVGMAAAILQGVPVTTLDVDVVHRRTTLNVQRLLRVLDGLDAVARHDTRRLRPGEIAPHGSWAPAPDHPPGRSGFLGSIDQDRGYEQLIDLTVELRLAQDLSIRVLALPALIEAKERSGRPKDLAALPVLRATLDEINRRS